MKNYLAIFFVALGIDYFIAYYLSGESKENLWFYFALLTIVPIFFAVKTALIKIIFWYFFNRDNAINEFLIEFTKNSWPKPNWDYAIGSDYLSDVIANNSVNADVRINAAKILGTDEALNSTQQIVNAFFLNNVLANAIQRYNKTAIA